MQAMDLLARVTQNITRNPAQDAGKDASSTGEFVSSRKGPGLYILIRKIQRSS